MKFKKVAAICCQTGKFALFDKQSEDGEVTGQWLGDGRAVYPIDGLPYMEKDNICAMFDITEKKREKLFFTHSAAPDDLNWDDTDGQERELENPKLRVIYNTMTLAPLKTSSGIVFIQEKYLAPLDKPEYMRLYERTSKSGGVYIVAKVGMLIQAVIMPADIVNKEFIDRMDDLTAQCRAALLQKNLMQAGRKQEQDQSTLFMGNESGGEAVREDAEE